jgi:hypothetical protein
MLQYSLPVMLLLLGVEPLVLYVIYIAPIKGLDDLVGAMVMFYVTGPILHIAYMELLYKLRSDLAPKQNTETIVN